MKNCEVGPTFVNTKIAALRRRKDARVKAIGVVELSERRWDSADIVQEAIRNAVKEGQFRALRVSIKENKVLVERKLTMLFLPFGKIILLFNNKRMNQYKYLLHFMLLFFFNTSMWKYVVFCYAKE